MPQVKIRLFALFAMACLAGCTKEIPDPESLDPIYADLTKKSADAQKSLEEADAKIAELKTKLETAEVGSIGKKDVEKELAHNRQVKVSATQDALYYKIRGDRRKVVDQMVYKEAFAAKQPWPDPQEYSDYMINQRVRDINMNWNSRVPKLQDRLQPKKAAVAEGEKKAE